MPLTFSRFHILENHSYTVSKLWNKLDYIGILVLMWAAGVATIFYGFPCDDKLRLTYSAAVCIPSPSTSGSKTDNLPDQLLRTVLRIVDVDFALRLTTIQKLAHSALLYFWVELSRFRHPRAFLAWMGGAKTPYVAGADGLDGGDKSVWRNDICSTGNLTHDPILAAS